MWLAIASSRSSLEMAESLNFFFIGDCSISLFWSPLSALVLMMGPMQSGLSFTDRIVKYVAKWAERKTKPASPSKGHMIPNNLSLNVEKTKEIVVDFRRVHTQHAPLTINGATVERVSSTKFLGVHITEDLSWTNNTAALAKKAQQRLYFLRKLRRARAPVPNMCTFYRGTIESILTSCITVWYGACNASCRKSLQRIVRAAEKIVGVSLPSLQDIYSTRLTRKALFIAGDPTHPTHSFFSLLPSGRRLRSLQARTSRLKDSFIHQAVRKLNFLPSLPPLPSFTPRTTELWHYNPPPPAPHIPSPPPPPPHLQLWPVPVTLCSIGLITTPSSIDCKLPLLTVW